MIDIHIYDMSDDLISGAAPGRVGEGVKGYQNLLR